MFVHNSCSMSLLLKCMHAFTSGDKYDMQLHVEAYLKLNMGRGFTLQPGLLYLLNKQSQTPAFVLRSSWALWLCVLAEGSMSSCHHRSSTATQCITEVRRFVAYCRFVSRNKTAEGFYFQPNHFLFFWKSPCSWDYVLYPSNVFHSFTWTSFWM